MCAWERERIVHIFPAAVAVWRTLFGKTMLSRTWSIEQTSAWTNGWKRGCKKLTEKGQSPTKASLPPKVVLSKEQDRGTMDLAPCPLDQPSVTLMMEATTMWAQEETMLTWCATARSLSHKRLLEHRLQRQR